MIIKTKACSESPDIRYSSEFWDDSFSWAHNHVTNFTFINTCDLRSHITFEKLKLGDCLFMPPTQPMHPIQFFKCFLFWDCPKSLGSPLILVGQTLRSVMAVKPHILLLLLMYLPPYRLPVLLKGATVFLFLVVPRIQQHSTHFKSDDEERPIKDL